MTVFVYCMFLYCNHPSKPKDDGAPRPSLSGTKDVDAADSCPIHISIVHRTVRRSPMAWIYTI